MKIFPFVRISDLKADTALKKSRLDTEVAGLRGSAREKFNENSSPLKFITSHPGLIFGGLASAFAGLKLTRNILKKRGVLAQMFSLSGVFLLKSLLPVVGGGFLTVLNMFFKNKKQA